jgi:hypothetical protein
MIEWIDHFGRVVSLRSEHTVENQVEDGGCWQVKASEKVAVLVGYCHWARFY